MFELNLIVTQCYLISRWVGVGGDNKYFTWAEITRSKPSAAGQWMTRELSEAREESSWLINDGWCVADGGNETSRGGDDDDDGSGRWDNRKGETVSLTTNINSEWV